MQQNFSQEVSVYYESVRYTYDILMIVLNILIILRKKQSERQTVIALAEHAKRRAITVPHGA